MQNVQCEDSATEHHKHGSWIHSMCYVLCIYNTKFQSILYLHIKLLPRLNANGEKFPRATCCIMRFKNVFGRISGSFRTEFMIYFITGIHILLYLVYFFFKYHSSQLFTIIDVGIEFHYHHQS